MTWRVITALYNRKVHKNSLKNKACSSYASILLRDLNSKSFNSLGCDSPVSTTDQE